MTAVVQDAKDLWSEPACMEVVVGVRGKNLQQSMVLENPKILKISQAASQTRVVPVET